MKQIILEKDKSLKENDYIGFIIYATKIYTNSSNYLSFGHKKFFQPLPKENFEKILKISDKFETRIKKYWIEISEIIYDKEPPIIGLEEKGGKTGYYLNHVKEAEIQRIDKILLENKIEPLNTRILKLKNGKFVVLIGSIEKKIVKLNDEITLYYGDFSNLLSKINENLKEALKYAGNDAEKKILELYIDFFKTGIVETHKESQRLWVKDKLPRVEFNIGWVETYIDPLEVRGFYEGWLGLFDKKESQKFIDLLDSAEELLKTTPWNLVAKNNDFEREVFIKPDFISTELVIYASEGSYEALNLPNYLDIQETHGFKNVSMQNAYLKFELNKDEFIEPEAK